VCHYITGKEAAAWKERYIEAFNYMEGELLKTRSPIMSFEERRKLRDQKYKVLELIYKTQIPAKRQCLMEDLTEICTALSHSIPAIDLNPKGSNHGI